MKNIRRTSKSDNHDESLRLWEEKYRPPIPAIPAGAIIAAIPLQGITYVISVAYGAAFWFNWFWGLTIISVLTYLLWRRSRYNQALRRMTRDYPEAEQDRIRLLGFGN